MAKPRPFTYTDENLTEIAFPLGGIGTGCISLEGRGSLRDYEIWGRPNKGGNMGYSYPVLWCRTESGETDCRVVHGPRHKNFQGEGPAFWDWGHGRFFDQGDGLPCFDSTEFTGTFPIATVGFEKAGHPLKVELKAFSPFIPLRTRDSGFPIAALVYRLTNRSNAPVELCLAWTLMNPVGQGVGETGNSQDQATAEYREEANCRGLVFTNTRFKDSEVPGGTVALTTDWKDATYTERWLDEGWFDAQQHFWNHFRESGELEPGARKERGNRVPGTLGLRAKLAPGETVELPFAISWVFPTTTKYWAPNEKPLPTWKPFYATQWADAFAAAKEFYARRKDLEGKTTAFAEALHQSTLPEELVESVSATLSTLHSPTSLRLEDGTFWAWEGCSPKDGCCSGTCSHVWNYASAHAWLFPEIARSIRETEYKYGFNCGPKGKEGAIIFRIPVPLTKEDQLWHAASDGQLGGIMQLYRDWRVTGDEETLKQLWPKAKHALEFAWVQWDRDKDGLVDGDQHNTYDINFQGPNPLTQFMYLGALKAATEIAGHLRDDSAAKVFGGLYASGRAKAEEKLWNGEYFVQTMDCLAENAPKYQHGLGCLSDQLFGALCAKVAGLGDVVDPKKSKSALKAIYRHNFKNPLGDHENLQRVYAFRDESGLLLCSWPNGGRPRFPFVYSDEVWTGIEYQVAAHLVYEGMVTEGLSIVKAIRARFDGKRRNPYNEYECGSHYARALSSWSVYLAATGLNLDAVSGKRELKPRVPSEEAFRCFYCSGSEWGIARLSGGRAVFEPIEKVTPS